MVDYDYDAWIADLNSDPDGGLRFINDIYWGTLWDSGHTLGRVIFATWLDNYDSDPTGEFFGSPPSPGTVCRWITNKPNTPNDVFSFTAPEVKESAELAREAVEKVTVYPNPYYAFNPQEPDRFAKFVTFYHLPKKATIRIFDLAGDLVRKLEKNNDDQFFKWDLKNEKELPVASGIYFAHIEMTLPDGSKVTKVLKIFIIQEAQILQYF